MAIRGMQKGREARAKGTGMGTTSPVGRAAYTPTSTYDDGTFTRTALVMTTGETGSVDVCLPDGTRLCQINVSVCDGGDVLIVDTIDVDRRYSVKRALTFSTEKREIVNVPTGGTLVSADFRKLCPHCDTSIAGEHNPRCPMLATF